MAVIEKVPGTEETNSTAKSKTSRKGDSKASGETAGTARSETKKKKRVRASRGKAAAVGGAERLRRAADKQVGKNSEDLAELLKNKALGGDLASAKMLVGLADGKKLEPIPEEECGPSFAELLAADPQWPGEGETGT